MSSKTKRKVNPEDLVLDSDDKALARARKAGLVTPGDEALIKASRWWQKAKKEVPNE